MLLINADKEGVQWVAKDTLDSVKSTMKEGDKIIKSAKSAEKEGVLEVWNSFKPAPAEAKARKERTPTPVTGSYEVVKQTVLTEDHPSYPMYQSLFSCSTIQDFLAANEGKSHRTKGETGILVTPKSMLAYAIRTGKIRLV